jgi:flagellar hook-basal body complex protein FliE
MINPISNIAPIANPAAIMPSAATGGTGEFGKLLEGTINSLESLQHDAGTSINQFLTGEKEDLHTTVLATQKAEMAFELGLQVRNKVVSAYQEIMKMQM